MFIKWSEKNMRSKYFIILKSIRVIRVHALGTLQHRVFTALTPLRGVEIRLKDITLSTDLHILAILIYKSFKAIIDTSLLIVVVRVRNTGILAIYSAIDAPRLAISFRHIVYSNLCLWLFWILAFHSHLGHGSVHLCLCTLRLLFLLEYHLVKVFIVKFVLIS